MVATTMTYQCAGTGAGAGVSVWTPTPTSAANSCQREWLAVYVAEMCFYGFIYKFRKRCMLSLQHNMLSQFFCSFIYLHSLCDKQVF